MPNVSSRLETATPLVSDLIKDIEKGTIKIPQFQRRFVWKADQALNLLDSIANNYPIGSLLLWRTDSKLAVERNIGDFRLPETDDLSPTDYVLDGQQRLTVIYSCLGGLPEGEGFRAGYHIDERSFIELGDTSDPLVLPLRIVFRTSELLDFRTALRSRQGNVRQNDSLDELIRVLTNYRIPVVLLKELTVEEVCPIFERINSSGTRLSTYDLMVAATWSDKFDLNRKAAEIQESLASKFYEDIDEDTILKCISAIQFGSIKKRDLFALRKLEDAEISQAVTKTKNAMLSAVDILSTQFGIYSWDFLPYEALVIVLAYLMHNIRSPSAPQARRIKQWFWRAAVSERYRVGGEAFVSKDMLEVLQFVKGGGGDPAQFGTPPPIVTWKQTSFRSNNSRARAFVIALSQLGPRNITNGTAIDIAEALAQWNKKEFHHISPRAWLRRSSAPGEHNAIANICILAASENKKVSDSDPKVYLPQCAHALGNESDAVFLSNLLPAPSQFDFASASYSDFLDYRSEIIDKLFARLCNGDDATPV